MSTYLVGFAGGLFFASLAISLATLLGDRRLDPWSLTKLGWGAMTLAFLAALVERTS